VKVVHPQCERCFEFGERLFERVRIAGGHVSAGRHQGHRVEQAALQAKVYQVEIWARDEFVRKGSFEMVVARLEKNMDALGSRIELAVDRMATKIDKVAQDQA
jgi:hypothetical protein